MPYTKFTLQKKWWQIEGYKIYDHNQKLWGSHVKTGILNVQRLLVNSQGDELIRMEKRGWGYNYNLFPNSGHVAILNKSGWGRPAYRLYLGDKIQLEVNITNWQKNFEFTDSVGRSQALVSASSASYNHLGLAFNNEELKEELIIGATILICVVQLRQRGAG